MRKIANVRDPTLGRNQKILIRRMEDCNYKRVEDIIKYLHWKYPEYKKTRTSVLARNIKEALPESDSQFKRKRTDDDDEEEFRRSASLSKFPCFDLDSGSESTARKVSNPKFDPLKSMLREEYENNTETNIEVIGNEDEEEQEEEEKEEDEEKDEEGEDNPKFPMFSDIGGMGELLEDLKYDVLIPLRNAELVKKLRKLHARAGPPTGILLHGPPGCGKTMLAQAIANEAGIPMYQIVAPEVVSGVSGQSEENIRELFSKARKTSPSIIFIDEIDAIAEKRENSQKGMETRIVTQLLKFMDNIDQECASPEAGFEGSNPETRPDHVLVIGATNRPDSLDPALRRPGRFSLEIELRVPDENARFEILSVLTRKFSVRGGLDLKKLSRDTQGFVGADLEDYVRKACLLAARKMINSKRPQSAYSNWWKQVQFNCGELEMLVPSMTDFEVALKSVQPSLKREGFSTVPDVKWEDVGGFDNIRQEFQSSIVHPIKHPEDYEAFREDLPAGFLLYGPPGCGKTLIAKAVANEAGINFIYIKGPELMNKYVGESEMAIRKTFSRARQCAPCILFIDEVDSLIANHEDHSGWVTDSDRVLNQLLIELDAAEERRGVYVIGATCRPELIDRALLRPGRFEQLIYVPLPSPEERGLILKALAKNRPIDDSVDLVAIAKSKACEHFCGADLKNLMRRASCIAHREMQSLRRTRLEAGPRTINLDHFNTALVGMSPSVNKEQREYYDRLSQRLSAA